MPAGPVLSAEEVAEIRAIGDNTGSMALKGAAPGFEGEPRPTAGRSTTTSPRSPGRWGIEPARDLVAGVRQLRSASRDCREGRASHLIAGLPAPLLALAAPAAAHEPAPDPHATPRSELAVLDIAETVETVDGAAGPRARACPTDVVRRRARTPTTSTNAAFEPDLPQFKVVYAYPSDRANRFAAWRDALQANVSLIGRFMGAQSGGRKAPRFDMGTSCGPEYVDIQVVALPAPAGELRRRTSPRSRAAVARRSSPTSRRPRATSSCSPTRCRARRPGYWSGLGAYWIDERPGADNHNNRGGLFSALWVPDGEPRPAPTRTAGGPRGCCTR